MNKLLYETEINEHSPIGRVTFEYAQDVTFDEIFGIGTVESFDAPCRITTVHSIKGETLDAVLLVLKSNAGNRQPYSKVLKDNILENEELRIVYVAATRPRSILVFAVPPEDKSLWLDVIS